MIHKCEAIKGRNDDVIYCRKNISFMYFIIYSNIKKMIIM